MTEFGLIAALGGSFAAGPGIEPVADPGAMRSSRNYPSLLAERLGARLVDLTVSGATTATILDVPQQSPTGAEFPPQIAGLPADAELVTITAGGEDLGFTGAMLAAAWTARDPESPVATMLRQAVPDGPPEPTPETIEGAADGLARIVSGARRRAPNARIVLVDHLAVVGANTATSDAVPIGAEGLAAIARIQDALRQATGIAAVRSGAELFAASAMSGGHALGDAEPWVLGFIPDPLRTAASFHPNAAGMAAIAEGLASRLLAEPES